MTTEMTAEVCEERSGNIVREIRALGMDTRRGFDGLGRRLDTLNGAVGRHDSAIAVLQTTQDVQDRTLDTHGGLLTNLQQAFWKRAGQTALIVGVATAVATLLKFVIG